MRGFNANICERSFPAKDLLLVEFKEERGKCKNQQYSEAERDIKHSLCWLYHLERSHPSPIELINWNDCLSWYVKKWDPSISGLHTSVSWGVSALFHLWLLVFRVWKCGNWLLGGPQGRKKLSNSTTSRKGSCTAELHGNAADVSHPSSKQLAQPTLCSSSRIVVFCSLTTAAASNCHPSVRVLFLFYRCLLPLEGYKPKIHFYMTPSFMRWPLEAVCSIALRPSIHYYYL